MIGEKEDVESYKQDQSMSKRLIQDPNMLPEEAQKYISGLKTKSNQEAEKNRLLSRTEVKSLDILSA